MRYLSALRRVSKAQQLRAVVFFFGRHLPEDTGDQLRFSCQAIDRLLFGFHVSWMSQIVGGLVELVVDGNFRS